MAEPVKLSAEQVKLLLRCGECGGPAYSHTALSRAAIANERGEAPCPLDVMGARASRVEKIVDEQVHLALQPFRELFVQWEAQLPDTESSDLSVVQLAECIIDLGNLLVETEVLPKAPVVLDLEDIDGDLAEIEEIAAARAMARAEEPKGVRGHAPGCDGWRPPTQLGFGREAPHYCKPGCPMRED